MCSSPVVNLVKFTTGLLHTTSNTISIITINGIISISIIYITTTRIPSTTTTSS